MARDTALLTRGMETIPEGSDDSLDRWEIETDGEVHYSIPEEKIRATTGIVEIDVSAVPMKKPQEVGVAQLSLPGKNSTGQYVITDPRELLTSQNSTVEVNGEAFINHQLPNEEDMELMSEKDVFKWVVRLRLKVPDDLGIARRKLINAVAAQNYLMHHGVGPVPANLFLSARERVETLFPALKRRLKRKAPGMRLRAGVRPPPTSTSSPRKRRRVTRDLSRDFSVLGQTQGPRPAVPELKMIKETSDAELVAKYAKQFNLHGFRGPDTKIAELKRLIYLERLFRDDPSLQHPITESGKHDRLTAAYRKKFPKDTRPFNVVRDRYDLRRNLPGLTVPFFPKEDLGYVSLKRRAAKWVKKVLKKHKNKEEAWHMLQHGRFHFRVAERARAIEGRDIMMEIKEFRKAKTKITRKRKHLALPKIPEKFAEVSGRQHANRQAIDAI